MKHILKFIFVATFFSLILNLSTPFAHAQTPPPTASSSNAALDGRLDNLLPKVKNTQGSQQLPSDNLKTEILPRIIRIALALIGTVSFVIFVYAGIMLITSQGNEEQVTKFKNTLIYSAVGLAFIAAAYAIVSGVMQLVFE